MWVSHAKVSCADSLLGLKGAGGLERCPTDRVTAHSDGFISAEFNFCSMEQMLQVSKGICLSAQSIVHGDVLSEKIIFSAHGSSNSANFGPDYLDP